MSGDINLESSMIASQKVEQNIFDSNDVVWLVPNPISLTKLILSFSIPKESRSLAHSS